MSFTQLYPFSGSLHRPWCRRRTPSRSTQVLFSYEEFGSPYLQPFTTWRYFMASRGMMNLLGEDDDNMFNTLRSAPWKCKLRIRWWGGGMRPCRNSVCVWLRLEASDLCYMILCLESTIRVQWAIPQWATSFIYNIGQHFLLIRGLRISGKQLKYFSVPNFFSQLSPSSPESETLKRIFCMSLALLYSEL